MVAVRVDVKIVYARPEMVHQLAQRPGRDGPVVRCILAAKLGVHWRRNLKGQSMCGCEATSEYYAGNEAALDAFAVFNGNVALFNQGLLLCISLVVGRRAASK